jgi:hypothetical protein
MLSSIVFLFTLNPTKCLQLSLELARRPSTGEMALEAVAIESFAEWKVA